MPLTKIQSLGITDGTIVNADINASAAIAASKLSGVGGLTEADQWRLTTNFSTASSTADITSNWERNDSTGFGYIGTGMTQSSGIFTFPTTGYYYIEHTATLESAGGNRYFGSYIQVTTNNSTYNGVTLPFASGYEAGANNTTTGSFIFDVTSTANCKVKFTIYNSTMTSVFAAGSSGLNYTSSTFIKLGDT
jgi:hypothetical protein